MNLSTCVFTFMFLAISVSCQDLWEDDQNAELHVCGRKLNEALMSVCKGTYNGYDKKSVSSFSQVKDFEYPMSNQAGNTENKLRFFSDDDATDSVLPRNLYHPRFRRSIIYECCLRPCSYKVLRGYCMI